MFAAEQGQERLALYVGRNVGTGDVEERRGVVDVLHHFPDFTAGLEAVGQAHDERRGIGLLVHEALVEPSVLAHVEALVGGVDHERGVEQTRLAEIVERAAHVVVEALEHLGVVAHVALVLELGEGFAAEVAPVEVGGERVVEIVVLGAAAAVEAAYHGQIVVGEARLAARCVHLRVVHDVHVPVVGYLHLLFGGGLAAGVVVVEGGGQGEGAVLVFADVLQLGQPAAVAGLVVEKEDEGPRAVALVLHPVDGLVGDDVRHVSLLAYGVAGHGDEVGVVVVALSRQHVVVVEARGCAHKVPLADERRLVAGLLHEFGHGLLRTVEDAVLVVGKSVLVGVLARDHAGAAGARERVGHVAVDELHAVGGDAVEIGGLDETVVVAAHHLGGVVVGHDVDDVVSSLCRGHCCRQRRGEQQYLS